MHHDWSSAARTLTAFGTMWCLSTVWSETDVLDAPAGVFELGPAAVAQLVVEFGERADVDLVADGPTQWRLNTPRRFSFPGGTRRQALDALCRACDMEWTMAGPVAVLRSARLGEDDTAEVPPDVLDYFWEREALDVDSYRVLRDAGLNKGQETTLLLWCPQLRSALRAAFDCPEATDFWVGLSPEEQQRALTPEGLPLPLEDQRLSLLIALRPPTQQDGPFLLSAERIETAKEQPAAVKLAVSRGGTQVLEMWGYSPDNAQQPVTSNNRLWPLPRLATEVGVQGDVNHIVSLRAVCRQVSDLAEATFMCVSTAAMAAVTERAAFPLQRYVSEEIASWPVSAHLTEVSTDELATAIARLLNAHWVDYQKAHMAILVPDAEASPRTGWSPKAPPNGDAMVTLKGLSRSVLANLDLVWTNSTVDREDRKTRVVPWDVLPPPVRVALARHAAIQASDRGKSLPLDLDRPFQWRLRFRLSGPLFSVRGQAPDHEHPDQLVEF